jgi:hypothetical protein
MHQAVSQLWPDMCPISLTMHDYAGTDKTGITGGSMTPPPARTIGEATKTRPGKRAIRAEKQLRSALAKSQRRLRELKKENDWLGSLPDPARAPFRGLPELGGPVDRRSHVGKAVGGADADENMSADAQEFAAYVGQFATSGDPTMRANASKVLAGLTPK